MQNTSRSLIDAKTLMLPLALAVLLVFSSQINFLLFHTLAESIAIFIAMLAAIVAWQMYPFTRNHYLMYLGCGYFWIAVLDMMHTLTYKGMSIFTATDTEIAVQFWVGTRYFEAIVLFTAPWFLAHRLKRNLVFTLFSVVAITLSVLVISGNFPAGFIEGKGLTAFKIYSEYVIIGIIAAAIFYLTRQRKLIDHRVFVLMVASMVLTIIAEMAFTFYASVYGLSNLAGHIFKLFSFWLIFVAVVRTTLREPFSALSKAETHYDAVPDAAVIVDKNGIIQHVNKAACLLVNQSGVELIGKHTHSVFHSEDVSQKDCPVCQAIAKGTELSAYEMKISDALWCDFSTSAIEEEDCFIEIIRDVTDKNMTASALKKSEGQLHTLIETLPDLIWLKDPEGVYLSCNLKFERLYGAKENEIIGKTDYDFVEKELADFFRKNDLKAIAAGKPSMNEEELTYADGHSEFVETIKTPMFDITGKLIGVLGVARDISERKKMEHALQENAERFIRWQESNFIGILHGRANGEIIEANNTLLNMLGYSRQDLLDKGLKWTKLTPNEFSYLHGVAIKEAEEKGYWSPFEIEYFHKSGHRVPVLVGGSVFQESSDQFIVFIIDLTERKQQEEKLRHSQKMDALGKMTGGIAHDYNNMLGVILGYADLLKTSLSEQPVQARYAHEIHRAGERGAKLTKKLLAFSRQNCSDTERLDINSLLCNEKHMLEKILTVRIRLVFDLENKLWPVWLDSSYMEDTIINMSINAMHAMEGTGQLTFKTRNETLSGSDAKELRLNAGDYVTLSITDTGSGMSEEVKQKIFDPFYSTKGESGTGLGLSQVYGFIEHSNGAIKVNSEPGKGAQFVLYFPRYIESDLEKQVEKNHYLADSNNNVKANGKILVVDDEPALLELTSEILRQHELNVLSAKSAKIALDILEYESIDILLSDVIMPEMDGYQLAAIVKEKYPAIKIQLVSGFTGGRNDDLLDDSLLNNLLSKPFNSKTLLKRIDELLNEK